MTTVQAPKKSGKRVGNDHVDLLISRYKKERWQANSKLIGRADALSTWYGLEELTEFLALTKEHGADGIKMYYGVYPTDPAIPQALQGRQTVVLVATKTSHSPKGSTNKDLYIDRNGHPEILAFNYGDICPPFCGSGGPPDYEPLGMSVEKTGITLLKDNDQVFVL